MHQVATAISTEFRAKYQNIQGKDGFSAWYHGLTVWSPNINIFRDPRWGRGQETYGEDPYLTFVSALLSSLARKETTSHHFPKTIATSKHFAVHSGPESTRHSVDVQVSRHDLEDTYLPAFRAAVTEGKAGSVMCAYNSVNRQPACANTPLAARASSQGLEIPFLRGFRLWRSGRCIFGTSFQPVDGRGSRRVVQSRH